MTTLPLLLPLRPATPWRQRLAALLHRAARALARPPRQRRPAPCLEFAHGVLYADGVRIGTLPVDRL